jgi:hypothetical protein
MNDNDVFDEFKRKHPQYSHLSGYEITERGEDDPELRGHFLDYAHDLRQRAERASSERDAMIIEMRRALQVLEDQRARESATEENI